ncbi:MAG: hypothetical protein AAF892_06265, partial [Cyanobacteria bacterium P01_D01_bin.71]
LSLKLTVLIHKANRRPSCARDRHRHQHPSQQVYSALSLPRVTEEGYFERPEQAADLTSFGLDEIIEQLAFNVQGLIPT